MFPFRRKVWMSLMDATLSKEVVVDVRNGLPSQDAAPKVWTLVTFVYKYL